MSFGGHVLDMINRVKQNATLNQKRRSRNKNNNTVNYRKANFKKVSQEELEKITQNIRAQAKADKRKNLLRLVVFSVIITSIILSMMIYFF